MKRRKLLRSGLALSVGLVAGFSNRKAWAASDAFEVMKTDAEWRELLTPDQYAVLREEATERPFANAYFDNKAEGIYHCAGCDTALFSSETKYQSGTGWPSFWQPISASAIGTKTDWKLVLPRTEVHCATCGGHLGHVFNDGPQPTGLRYCLNSAALNFVEA
ncbi:MAG: peptide-methionine (R)-S-oxide reductase MsrB [Cyanobacteria bacterium P01_A01_bin.3]